VSGNPLCCVTALKERTCFWDIQQKARPKINWFFKRSFCV
jgi:hypothetical protein